MKWFIVWASMSSHPKWLALNMEQRGAWATLMCYAAAAEPRWVLSNRQHAELLIQRDGSVDPAATIEALVTVGLLDENEDRTVEIHDHAAWQPALSETREAWAERKRRSRQRTRESDSLAQPDTTVTARHDAVPSVTETSRTEERKERKKGDSRTKLEREEIAPCLEGACTSIKERWGWPELSAAERDGLEEAAARRTRSWDGLLDEIWAADSEDPTGPLAFVSG